MKSTRRLLNFLLPQAPVSEVHVEAILDDEIFEKLLSWAKSHPNAMLMLHVIPNWGNYTNLVKERHLQLKKLGNPIGLHVHLGFPARRSIDKIPYEDQYRLIKSGVDFLSCLNIPVADFAPGNWTYNDDTVKGCLELGMKRFHIWHEIDHVPRDLGAEVVLVKKFIHDYDLV
jgi:hypothetical protein